MIAILLYLALTPLGPLVPLAPNAPNVQVAEEGHELRYYKAWHVLEVERKPSQAAVEFSALLREDALERQLRARCQLGLARCQRLLGRKREAEGTLREIVAHYGDLPEIARQAQELLGSGKGGPTRFIAQLQVMVEDQVLDLDTGALYPATRLAAGGGCEVTLRDGHAQFLVAPAPASISVRDVLPGGTDDVWLEIVTDEGRTSWVQVLAEADVAVLRYVTRLAGKNVLHPVPKNPCCVGKGDSIEVWFDALTEYASYRVERRRGGEGVFEPQATIRKPPFVDRAVTPGMRYGYRVTGVTRKGDEGIPATVQGTVESLGVRAGRVSFTNSDKQIDLLTGMVVAEGGDLRIRGFYGSMSAVGFYDYMGGTVYARNRHCDADLTVWDQLATRRDGASGTEWKHWQLDPIDCFEVPLRGGGIARCRWQASAEEPRSSTAVLIYEVFPDGDSFPETLALEVVERNAGARLSVAAPAGWQVHEIHAESVVGGGAAVDLPVTGGAATDREARPGTIRTYSAVAVDRHGRRGPAGSASLVRMPAGTVTGEFRLKFHQGFSLEAGEIVDFDHADVVFLDCAAEIASVTLAAPGGIVNLDGFDLVVKNQKSREWLFDSIAAVSLEELQLSDEADGDRRNPEDDVFVMETRHGALAKLAILARDQTGPWWEREATIRFAVSYGDPVFFASSDLARTERGVVFDCAAGDAGEFSLAENEGFSLERGEKAPAELADVVLRREPGGVDLLIAPAGITNLRTVLQSLKNRDRVEMYESVVACDPREISLQSEARGDRRFPTTDVFLLRTLSGGWAKLVIHRRSRRPDRSEVVNFRYVVNEFGPLFGRHDGEEFSIRGVLFDRRW